MVELDVSMLEQMGGKAVEQGADAGWWRSDVDVVQKGHDALSGKEVCLESPQSEVQSQREQGWHEWVALFAALCLGDGMGLAMVVCPEVGRRLAVEQTRERQCCLCMWCVGTVGQSSEHCSAADMVVCSDAVDR